MSKTIYYIGAGASFHSLPLVNDIPRRISLFRDYVRQRQSMNKLNSDFVSTYLKELDSLIIEIGQSTSIDSYAKELYNGNKQLEHLRLKAVLSGYMLFEQLEKTQEFKTFLNSKVDKELFEKFTMRIDKRYRTFWAEKLNNNVRFPNDDFSIVSWNYDMQFEFAYSRMFDISLKLAQQDLNVYPSENTVVKPGFSLTKLNGTAGLYKAYNSNRNDNLVIVRTKTNDHVLDFIIDHLKHNYHRSFAKPMLTFAWENEGDIFQARQHAKQILSEAETLIVIGYSFPLYNREVDKDLLEGATNLKKILYQSPSSDVEDQMEELFKINPNFKSITKPKTRLDTFVS